MTDKPHPNRTTQPASPLDLLRDPTRATVSVSQAALILGVAKSTAHAAYKQTGYLSPGVPVMQVGRRYTVSVFHLRAALGMADPEEQQ